MKVPALLPILALSLALGIGPRSHAAEAKDTPGAAPQAAPTPANSPATASPAYPPEVKELLAKGNTAFQKADFKAAKKHFEKLLELLPGHPAALANLASVEYRLDNLPEAESLLRRAVHAQPDFAGHWITLGIICLEQEKLYEAISAFSQAVAVQPDNARAHSYLGVTFGRQQWFSAAETELRKALELDPNYADAHFNLALTYLNRKPSSLELARRHYHAARDLGAAADPAVEKRLEQAPAQP